MAAKRGKVTNYGKGKKVIYRYHNGAQPGDERFAVPRKGNLNALDVVRSPFPGPGDIRYAMSQSGKTMYRLHDGAPVPELSRSGKEWYGFTGDEMRRFMERQRNQIIQRRNQYEANRERREREFQKQLAEQQQQQQGGLDQDSVNRMIDKMSEQGLIPGGMLGGAAAKGAMNQLLDNKSVLNRAMDVLSRPLYAVGNVLDRRADKDREEDNFSSWKTPLRAFGDAAEFMNPIDAIMDYQSGNKREIQERVDISQEAWQGLSGRDKTTPSMVLQEHYGTEGASGFALGLGADIALDPLTYIPVVGPIKAGTQALRGAIRAGQGAIRPAGNAARELAENIPLRNLTDEMVDRNIPINERISRADRAFDAVAQPIIRNKFDQEANSALQSLVDNKYISQNQQEALLRARGTEDIGSVIQRLRGNLYHRSRKVTVDPTTGAPSVTRASDEALPPAGAQPGTPQAVVREAMESVVSAATLRGRINNQLGKTKPDADDYASLRERGMNLTTQIGELGAPIGTARKYLQNTKGLPGAVFRAHEKVAGNAVRAASSISRLLSGQRLSSVQAGDALRRLGTATTENGWRSALMQSLGQNTDVAKQDILQVVDDYVMEVGQRPTKSQFATTATFQEANRTWHLGLYQALSSNFGDRVNSAVTDVLMRSPEAQSMLSNINAAQVRKLIADEDVAEDIAEKFRLITPQLAREIPDQVLDLFRSIGEKTRTVEEAVKLQLYELVAMADRLPLPDDFAIRISPDGRVETNLTGQWDDFIQQRAEIDIPQLAERSYNNVFFKMFNPRYGMQDEINDLRMRLMGSANENVKYRIDKLRQSIGSIPRSQRIKEFADFVKTGAIETNGVPNRTAEIVLNEFDRIISKYDDVDWFRTAFGDSGKPNIGDLNRWLPDNMKFVGETVSPGSVARRFNTNMLDTLPQGIDPLKFLWNLSIANEKVLSEKATLLAMADTFGVPRENRLIAQKLKDAGYRVNQHFGDQYLFHPDISAQIDNFYNAIHRAPMGGKFEDGVRVLDFVQNMYRRLVTVYNFPAFLIRNLIGDTFSAWITGGVRGSRGVASYRQAIRVMRDHQKFDELVSESIHDPMAGIDDILNRPSVNSTLFKTRSGQSISSEQLYAEYVKRGLSPTQFSTTMGLAERLPLGGRATQAVRGATLGAMERATEATSQMGRLAVFIHNVKTSTKPIEQAFDDAADMVRKSLYDYNDFTPFERGVMSRIFPFYRFLRKNTPHMAAMLFADPQRAMVPDKALRNLALAQGYEIDPETGDPMTDEIMPDWIQDRNMWPIGEWNGQTIYASPDYQMNTFLRQFGDGSLQGMGMGWLYGNASPYLQITAEQATDTTVFDQDINQGRLPLGEAIASEFPQYRNYEHIQQGDYQQPGRAGQMLGFGTVTNSPNAQFATLYEWIENNYGPEGLKAFQEGAQFNGVPESTKPLTEKQRNAQRVQGEVDRDLRNLTELLEMIENG